MKTGVKGKGCACAAPSQTRTFSLRKKVPGEGISKALGCFHLGKIPFGSRGQSRGCSPGVHCSPPLLPRGSPRHWVLPRARRTGSPQPLPPAPAPGRAVPASQGGGGGARHPPGAEGADSLAPCLENGPFKLAAKAPNMCRGIRGQRGVPPPGSSCVGGKAHLQLPPAPEQPLFPLPGRGAPRAFVVLCSRGSFPPSPCSHGNVSCKDFLPKDNPP